VIAEVVGDLDLEAVGVLVAVLVLAEVVLIETAVIVVQL
jgi:hypothetical protein